MRFLFVLVTCTLSVTSAQYVVKKCNYDFDAAIANDINLIRSAHGTEAIVGSPQITKLAQEWAESLAQRNVWEHKPDNCYGDLVWKKWFYNWPITVNGSEVVNWWAVGASDYHYYGREPPEFKLQKYNYLAQLLWRKTKHFGFGCAYRNLNDFEAVVYVTGFFDPPGNQHCQYKYNVLPDKRSPLYRKLTEGPQIPEPSCVVRPSKKIPNRSKKTKLIPNSNSKDKMHPKPHPTPQPNMHPRPHPTPQPKKNLKPKPLVTGKPPKKN